jgi:hypothetical protein
MKTKLLMTISALALAAAGIILSFLPDEIIHYLNSSAGTSLDALTLQILGALYFAFAMQNWTARASLIGGIYGRAITIGNLTHFAIGALALVKGYFSSHTTIILTATLLYSFFAISFAIVFYTHPKKSSA